MEKREARHECASKEGKQMLTHDEYVREMVANRRTLHKRPEEGWTEFETTYFLASRLRALGLRVLLGRAAINPNAGHGTRSEAC